MSPAIGLSVGRGCRPFGSMLMVMGGALTLLCGTAQGQSAADGFNPGADNDVLALAVQADGKLVVGGRFTMLGGAARSSIGRLNADGLLDGFFNPGADGEVDALAVQADGKILVGGAFTTLGGQPRSRIGRLNGDGSPDITFDPGADGLVNALAVQADGKIVVGGFFTMLGGAMRHGIGRLNANGSLDNTFNPGADSQVAALAVQADGKIVVGGYFSILGGAVRHGIGRLNANGSLDGAFDPETDNGSVLALAVQADGRIVVGGIFGMLGGAPRSAIGRLNVDGSRDFSFNPGAGPAAQASVAALALQTDGEIVVGGYFTTLGGTARTSLGRLHFDGSLDTGFDRGVGPAPPFVFALAVQADGKIVVGGTFTTLGGQPRGNVGRLYADGLPDTTFDPGTGDAVEAVALQADGKLVVGGYFTTLGGAARNHIGRLNVDGSLDSTFNPGTDFQVSALAVQPDGKIVVGGGFTMLAGTPRSNIGRLNADGSLDFSFDPGADNLVNALAVQADGKIVVGGNFSMLGGAVRRGIGRLNADGSLDGTFNPGAANTTVWAIVVQADGKIVVGGSFDTLGGLPRSNIGRLNASGQPDTGFDPGANDFVNTLALQGDGKLVVGGYFSMLGGAARSYIGRLDTNGLLDSSFDPGASDGFVFALAVQADGQIVVGGSFSALGGQPRSRIGRLNADGSLDTNFNPGAAGPAFDFVTTLALQVDGKIVVGGIFTTLAGQPRSHIGRLTNAGRSFPFINVADAALQHLTVNSTGTAITWSRSGSSPEADRVTFESSTDAVSYSPLGLGTRVAGGWQLTGLNLPINEDLFIRARGVYATGGDSDSVVELVRNAFVVASVAAIDLGTGVGQPGGVACVPTTLTAAGVPVAATTNDIAFDPTQVTFDSSTIDPAIGGGSAANKQLSASAPGAGSAQVQVGGNANLIPSGLLYTSQFAVRAGATVGPHAVTNAPAATDPSANSIVGVGGAAGQIIVTTCTGDCNGDGHVSIGEVTKCVNLFLGQPLCNPGNPNLSCPVADATLNGTVSIGEVTQCVSHFLNGC